MLSFIVMLVRQNSLRKPCPFTCSDLAGFSLDVWVMGAVRGGSDLLHCFRVLNHFI